jgi:hypothetical protein
MRTIFRWLGWLLCLAGVGLIAAHFVMTHLGMSASYNLGDPAKFEFRLVQFWQIGLGGLVLGLIMLWLSRRPASAA